MTTAHRPTWKAAVGQSSEGGWSAGGARSAAVATLDVASHTKLKFRTGPQVVDRQKALKESLLKLQEAEKQSAIQRRRPVSKQVEEEGRLKLLKQTADVDDVAISKQYDDDDAIDDDDDDRGGGWNDVDPNEEDSDDLDASSDEDDSSDDDDDEAALQAELEKIRAEREAARLQQAETEAAEQEAKLEEAALLGNPLLAGAGGASGKLKRKWNDDVVFRNQAKGEPKIEKRFINDTVRNDFHKRFLNKFMR